MINFVFIHLVPFSADPSFHNRLQIQTSTLLRIVFFASSQSVYFLSLIFGPFDISLHNLFIIALTPWHIILQINSFHLTHMNKLLPYAFDIAIAINYIYRIKIYTGSIFIALYSVI